MYSTPSFNCRLKTAAPAAWSGVRRADGVAISRSIDGRADGSERTAAIVRPRRSDGTAIGTDPTSVVAISPSDGRGEPSTRANGACEACFLAVFFPGQ